MIGVNRELFLTIIAGDLNFRNTLNFEEIKGFLEN